MVPSPFKDDGSFLWGGEWRPAVTGARRQRTKQRAILPTVGDAVTCRVQRINQRLATVDILCVGDVPLRESCAGLIRREDIQVIGSESVEVYRCFRPGDIVLARVISLGDARAYYLTSGDPELGVVLARSQSEGAVMTPVSFKEMECPITKGACASNLRPRPRRSDWTERTTAKWISLSLPCCASILPCVLCAQRASRERSQSHRRARWIRPMAAQARRARPREIKQTGAESM